MKEAFKKIEEAAHLVSQSPEGHNGACIIIATPDTKDENSHTLCFINGVGVNIIEMMAFALSGNGKLRSFVKDALALIEGQTVMAKLSKVHLELKAECKAKESEPNTACDSGEESGPENDEQPTTDSLGKENN